MDCQTWDQQRVTRSKRCAWCGKVKLRDSWIDERRRNNDGGYTHGICGVCLARFFLEDLASR